MQREIEEHQARQREELEETLRKLEETSMVDRLFLLIYKLDKYKEKKFKLCPKFVKCIR